MDILQKNDNTACLCMPLLTPHSSPDSQSKNHDWLLLLILLGICGVLYLPAANGPMLLDDRSNLLFNQGIRMQDLSWQSIEQAATSMQETFASRHPWLNRPISFISFGLNHWASSTPHLAMKLTNIALHLINAMLLFILLRMMLRVLSEIDHRQASAIALIATGIWLLHPLMVSTVLYTVQRMTELSTLFILLGLMAFVHFRLRLINDHHALWQGGALVMLATLCAYLSKENGILLLPLCLLLELSLFRHRFDHMQSRWVKRLYWLLLLLPTLALIYYLAHTLLAAPDYQPSSRTFTQWQRLLSQGPVMVDYLHWFIWPSAEHLAFLHDGRNVSQSLFSPLSTLWSWLFLLLLLAISAWSVVTKRVIWLGIGLGWFFIGHLLESTVLNLELAFEHRNYLPYAGLALITAVATQHVLNFFTRISLMQTSLALVLLCTPLTVLTEARTERWQSEERLLEHWQQVAQTSGRYWTKLAAKHVRDQDLSKAFEALKQGSRQVPWED
ncbi:MAG: hypothetical protein R3183_03215, partial [Oleiphilaceae bacterium]|nr:hypothetical protein [Oleiphilaceae bacterium]